MNKVKTGLIAVGCLYAGAYIAQYDLQSRIEETKCQIKRNSAET